MSLGKHLVHKKAESLTRTVLSLACNRRDTFFYPHLLMYDCYNLLYLPLTFVEFVPNVDTLLGLYFYVGGVCQMLVTSG